MELGEHHREILRVLSPHSGLLTRRVRERVGERIRFGVNDRQKSAAIRSWLCELRKAGFVGTLDNDKPELWTVTQAGLMALTNLHGTGSSTEEADG